MRTILVGDFAAYILQRGRNESPSQYETFKGIIEGVRCGGIKVPMDFDGFGKLHFQDGGPDGRRINLNGTSGPSARWDITESVVTLHGSFPKALIETHRARMNDDVLLLGDALDLPFHRDRAVYSLVHEEDRVTYHLDHREERMTWDQARERIEGPDAPPPGILDHMMD